MELLSSLPFTIPPPPEPLSIMSVRLSPKGISGHPKFSLEYQLELTNRQFFPMQVSENVSEHEY